MTSSIVRLIVLCAAASIATTAVWAQQRSGPVAPTGTSLIQPAGPPAQRVAVLQGLDKVTARPQRIVVPIGKSVQFGTLVVQASECLVNAPEGPPESAAHLVITDHKPGNPPQRLFAGWMFATAPALSGLDHAVYDVTVLACTTASQASAPASTR